MYFDHRQTIRFGQVSKDVRELIRFRSRLLDFLSENENDENRC